MKQLQLKNLSIMSSVKSGEEADAAFMLLLTDPNKITHYINFFQALIPNASEENKKVYQNNIDTLIQIATNQIRFTANVYTLGSEEVAEAVKEVKTVEVEVTDPDKVKLKIVSKGGEDVVEDNKVLREKYAAYIKTLDIKALELKVAELNAAGNNADAEELARFILGEGLFKAKKPAKKWSEENIAKFISTHIKTAEVKTEASSETDPTKKYASYIPLTEEEEKIEAVCAAPMRLNPPGSKELLWTSASCQS